jgi:DNA-binding beta-propeller fold protein YncE
MPRREARAGEVAVSSDGGAVFVTGFPGVVIAYDASTGHRLWVDLLRDRFLDEALIADPDGRRVYVVGSVGRVPNDIVTIAYGTKNGVELWRRRFEWRETWSHYPRAVALVDSAIFVTASAWPVRNANASRLITLAYETGSGSLRWIRRFDGAPGEPDLASDIGVDAVTGAVVVSGISGFSFDIATVAYDLVSGDRRWTASYDGGGDYDEVDDLVTDAASAQTYILATLWGEGIMERDDFGLIAYDTATGSLDWAVRYGGPGELRDQADALAVSPDGQRLYVTGSSADSEGNYDSVVLAYSTS